MKHLFDQRSFIKFPYIKGLLYQYVMLYNWAKSPCLLALIKAAINLSVINTSVDNEFHLIYANNYWYMYINTQSYIESKSTVTNIISPQ